MTPPNWHSEERSAENLSSRSLAMSF